LAFGTLLLEGTPVRLSGQDCERGTFSHRHAVLYDSTDRTPYVPLMNIASTQERFCVHNSSLSEAAVLGFDAGYAIDYPEMLCMWEAQFGDFANGAQVIIDQFITSSESKWQRTSNITLLLPHGYEGQGPEHSSARLERFLQACAENNIQVCNLTTPAQYFHVLRRQMKRSFRKPLIIMSPKSLLRHKECVSAEPDFTQNHFQEILDDPTAAPRPQRLIFCSGKVYYDLAACRMANSIKNTTILRMEQFYPLNAERIQGLLKKYEGFRSVVWCQEEPRNMGGWTFMAPILEQYCGMKPIYAGRKASASPAAGSLNVHKLEQDALVEHAFNA
jgi:2-oxoglutarate dehydrogenase E1 component